MFMVAEHPGHLSGALKHHAKALCRGQGKLVVELKLQLPFLVVLVAF
jgi:hypothetical protein